MRFSPEQRAASAAFDRFVVSTDEVLQRPAVVAALGSIATDLRHINGSAFLPNIRAGRFVVPKKQRGNGNLAIVPLTEEQADNAYEVTADLMEEPPVRSWTAQEAVASHRYGLKLDEELEALFKEGPKGDANAPTLKGLRPNTLARTSANLGCTPNGLYTVSRPTLMIRSRLSRIPSVESGAVMAHEEVHVSDLLEDGPLYATLTYGAATELRAYHVSAAIYRAANIDSPESQDSQWIESLREREVGTTSWPFTPNARLVEVLTSTGKI